MSLESDIELLARVKLFGGLSRDQLRLLAFGAEHRRLRAGDILFRAEARADAGFVVAAGTVHLVTGEGEARQVAQTVGPGALLGELAMLADTRRPVSAVAAADCDLLRIPRPLFRRMLEEYPELAARLHAELAADLLALTTRILALEPRFAPDEEEDETDNG